MTVQITCPECRSSIHVYPQQDAERVCCPICKMESKVHFLQSHEKGELDVCPVCDRKDFYQQRDFNRKIGVSLFVLAAILSIFTYGISFIVLYIFDLILFKKISTIVVCYKCQTIFRQAKNTAYFTPFNHEMNDRIVYADHQFDGKPLTH